MPPTIQLQPADLTDVPTLRPLMDAFRDIERISVDPAALDAALAHLIATPELGRVWLFEEAGARVGYAVLTFGYDLEFAGRDAFLTEIYLVPAARGRGLGAAALAAIEAAAAALKVRSLHLMVRPENQAAVALYQRAGFAAPPRTFLSKLLTS